MTTYRVPHDREYTCISNAIFDPNLRPADIGVLAYLLSLPDDWEPNAKQLSKALGCGDCTIKSSLKRLKKAGYLVCRQIRDKKTGRIVDWTWDIFEKPHLLPNSTKTDKFGNVIQFSKDKPDIDFRYLVDRSIGQGDLFLEELEELEESEASHKIKTLQAVHPQFDSLPLENQREINNIDQQVLSSKTHSPTPLSEKEGEERVGQAKETSTSKRGRKKHADRLTQKQGFSQESKIASPDQNSAPDSCGEILHARAEATNLSERASLSPVRYDPMLGIRPPRQRPKFLYPDGPWLTASGRIDESFIEDRANLWRLGDSSRSKDFGKMPIEDVKGLVAKFYMRAENHPCLEIDWATYVAKQQRYLDSVKARAEVGIQITEAETKRISEALPAVTAEPVEPICEKRSVPLPVRPLEVVARSVEVLPESIADRPIEVQPIATDRSPEPIADRPQPETQPTDRTETATEIEGLTPEELVENQRRLRAAIAAKMKGRELKPSVVDREPRRSNWTWDSAAEALKSGDRILIAEAARWAEAKGGEVDRDENGTVTAINPPF